MKQGQTLTEMVRELDYQSEASRDYVTPINKIEFGYNPESKRIQYHASIPHFGGIGGEMTSLATRQMTQEMDIPPRFVETLLTEDPEYLPVVMERRGYTKATTRMLRTMDNTMYAAKSSMFDRTHDNHHIAKAILPTIMNSGFKIESCNVDMESTLMHIKCIHPDKQLALKVGDVITFGFKASNSSGGLRRAAIEHFNRVLACLNGMTVNKSRAAYSKVHRGSRMPDGVLPSVQTTTYQMQAVASEMRDVVLHFMSDEFINETKQTLEASTERKLTGAKLDDVVGELGKIVGYNQTEGEKIFQYLVEGGDLSQWGVANAVTRYSQDVDSYERASELEEIGGKIITLKQNQWKTIERIQEAA